MKKDKSEVRQVLVDVPVNDKNGRPITVDSLSSGGARGPGGYLIAQYRNPRLPESAPAEPAAEREFDEYTRRESESRRRREEEETQAEYDRKVKSASDGANWFLEEVVYPAVERWWRTRGPDDLKRAGRWLATPFRHDKAIEMPVPNAALATDAPQVNDEEALRAVELSAVSLDDVIQMDDYRDRRSA